ncbi:hypothetical protein, partial [Achromobacter phage kwar_LB4]
MPLASMRRRAPGALPWGLRSQKLRLRGETVLTIRPFRLASRNLKRASITSLHLLALLRTKTALGPVSQNPEPGFVPRRRRTVAGGSLRSRSVPSLR